MAERKRQEERGNGKQMKRGQGGRQSLTSAAPLVVAEVVTCPAAAQVGALHADTVVLAAMLPVCTRIDGCREQDTHHHHPPAPASLGQQGSTAPGLQSSSQHRGTGRKSPGMVVRPTNMALTKIQGKNTAHFGAGM